MKRTAVKKTICVPADAVWEVVSGIVNIECYLPGVSSSELLYQGTNPVRSIILLDGSHYKEVITGINHQQMELSYEMVDPTPFTYTQLKGTMRIIRLDDNSCEVCWVCTYQPEAGQAEEIETLLTLLMTLGIKGLEKCCKKMLVAA